MNKLIIKIKTNQKGFTLIELMVSISVFIVIMVISMGSVLSVIDANRKSQSLRSVMDNLNLSLESMTRSIRFGTSYHCDAFADVNVLNTNGFLYPRDCSGGASSIAFVSQVGTQVIYKLVDGRIIRKVGSGPDYYMTGSDVTITNLTFIVLGSRYYNNGATTEEQPKVIIIIGGYVGNNNKPDSRSAFSIQTTVSQRLFDSQ